jgi:CubicO group peptidase (beta-lactamase class C family)
MKSKTLPFFLLAFFSSQTVFAQGTPATPDYGAAEKDLSAFIPKQMRKAGVQGLSIALVDDTGVLWTQGFGYADAEKKIPATADTLYPTGAPAKLLTAGEILKLEGEGRLRLDDPIQRHVPGFSIHSRFQNEKPITLRALLANHSGLPAFFIRGSMAAEPENLADFVADLKSDYLTDPPQTLYKYSYVDYDLLGRVVELKRKTDFAQAMEEDWLKPLGMASSTFRLTPDVEWRMAKGYLRGKETPFLRLREVPATGLVSSARDMARFLCFALGASLAGGRAPLRPEESKVMFQPQFGGDPMNFGHEVALGWMLSGLEVEGSQGTAWQDGVYPPYVSEAAVLYRQKLGVVFLANSEEAIKIEDDILKRALKLMLNAKYGLGLSLEKKKIRMSPTVKVPRETLDRDTGFYSAAGQLTPVRRSGDHLSTVLLHTGLDLVPISQNTFVPRFMFLFFFPIDFPENAMTFSNVEGHDITVFNGFTYPIVLEKIQPVRIPESWQKREGEYEQENPEDWLRLEKISLGEREGFLTVTLRASFPAFDIQNREYQVALQPISDEDAIVPGLFYGDEGTLHAVGENGLTRVFYSGYWFRKKSAGP